MKQFIKTLKQMDKSRLVLWMNRLAVPLQFLAACGVYFVIEWISRHSFTKAWSFLMTASFPSGRTPAITWSTPAF